MSVKDIGESRVSLRRLCDGLKSCLNGRSKMLVTFAGCQEISSGSYSVTNHLHWNDPICLYIGEIVKALPDFGLYCGIITCSFLSSNKQNLQDISSIQKTLVALLDRAKTPVEVSIKSIQPLVAGVLSSKYILKDVLELSVQIVKSVLLSMTSARLGHVIVSTSTGQDDFRSFPGILYELESDQEILYNNAKVVLFTESITDDHINTFKATLSACRDASVDVVACQKVIGPLIKRELRKYGVLGIERMGLELAHGLSLVLKAPPISTLLRSIHNVTPFVGIASMKTIHLNKPYLLIESKEGISTLFVSSRTLYGPEELKILIDQGISTTATLLTSPFILPGGGYLEVWLCKELTLLCCPSPTLDAFKKALLETIPISSFAFFNCNEYMGERCFQDAPAWDCFNLKRNALMTALETIVSTQNIGLLVSD